MGKLFDESIRSLEKRMRYQLILSVPNGMTKQHKYYDDISRMHILYGKIVKLIKEAKTNPQQEHLK